jgi:hypothetical protein
MSTFPTKIRGRRWEKKMRDRRKNTTIKQIKRQSKGGQDLNHAKS